MSLLIRIDDKRKIVLDKVCVKLCPKLKLLNEQQLLYIVLVYDYHSKYRQFPTNQRKDKARYEVYGGNSDDPESIAIVQEGIMEYRGLQYDTIQETISAYTDKVAKLRHKLIGTDEEKEISSIMKSIELLNKSIKIMEAEINDRFTHAELLGGGKLSLLEMMQENLSKFRKEARPVSI